MYHISYRDFWWNIKSARWLNPPTAQIWHPATSGFSENLWKGRDFRPLMRFRKIWQSSWWQLEELHEVLRCLLWRRLRYHCPKYNFSWIFNKCLFFIVHGWILSGHILFVGESKLVLTSKNKVYIYFLIFRGRHWGSKRLGNFFSVMQQSRLTQLQSYSLFWTILNF